MLNAYDTLFLPFLSGSAPPPEPDQDVLFLNAAPCTNLQMLQHCGPDILQHFRPYAAQLEAQNYSLYQNIPDKLYDYVLLHTPKHKQEAQYLLASGAERLQEGGVFIAAAPNDAGGKRLKSWFTKLGFEAIQEQSKHKARVVWAMKSAALNTAEWIKAGAMQNILNGQYQSQPGIFGWNKIDKGSAILAQHLPNNLTGIGADFGCGYGYLSHQLLQQNNGIDKLFAIDADARAIKAAKANLRTFETRIDYLWKDLTKQLKTLQNSLDWIVMNPPFHTGKSTDIDIGKAFIATAHRSLKTNATLYMVANAHLPYEQVLKELYSSTENLFEGSGFKLFAAQK